MCPTARRRARRSTGHGQRAAQKRGRRRRPLLERRGETALPVRGRERQLRAQFRPQPRVELRAGSELARGDIEGATAQPAPEGGVRRSRRQQRQRVEGRADGGVVAEGLAAVPDRDVRCFVERGADQSRDFALALGEPCDHDGHACGRRSGDDALRKHERGTQFVDGIRESRGTLLAADGGRSLMPDRGAGGLQAFQ